MQRVRRPRHDTRSGLAGSNGLPIPSAYNPADSPPQSYPPSYQPVVYTRCTCLSWGDIFHPLTPTLGTVTGLRFAAIFPAALVGEREAPEQGG
jgi:hypothetical protein